MRDKEFDPALGQFGLNSTEVLIPSFLAAYSGKDVNQVENNPFLSLKNILPNWRLTYDGLSRITWVKDNFQEKLNLDLLLHRISELIVWKLP